MKKLNYKTTQSNIDIIYLLLIKKNLPSCNTNSMDERTTNHCKK